jgi:putative heme-binding domain-containing protein
MVYLGDNFPDRYRGGVFMCNLHGNRINHDILERKGSTYVARHGKDFMFANDPWFRGIALCYGPDGAVYVSDWTDTGECHNYKVVDRTNGRIYKISYGTPKNPAEWLGKNWDLSKVPDEKLVELQTHKNEYFVRTARRILQERAAAGKLAKETRPRLERMTFPGVTKSYPASGLHALWALHVTGGIGEKLRHSMLGTQKYSQLRGWAIRLTFEDFSTVRDKFTFRDDFGRLPWEEQSPGVRLEMASALQRVPLQNREYFAEEMAKRAEDADDPCIPLMLWYAIEPLFGDGLMNSERFEIPLLREYSARRSVEFAAKKDFWDRLIYMLDSEHRPPVQRDFLRGIHAGLKGRRQVSMPKTWQKVYLELVQSPLPEVRELTINLAVQFGDKRAFAALGRIVADRKEPSSRRRSALSTLLFQQKSDLVPVLQDLLGDTGMRDAAIKGLARFDDPKTPSLLLKDYASFTDEEKADAVHTLTSRPAYAQALLDAMEKKQVPRQDVSAYSARQIHALGNKDLTDRLTKIWGAIRPASQEKTALMKKYKAALTPDNLKNANLPRGRLLYQKTCAACHRLFDDGGAIGPELTGSQRGNLDYILENMLDPSAIVAKDYQVTILVTTSGRTLTGIIKKETDKAVTVQTQNELIVLPKEDIESRQPTRVSLMPEGQLEPLSMNEVRDLVAYLASPAQVPLPASRK